MPTTPLEVLSHTDSPPPLASRRMLLSQFPEELASLMRDLGEPAYRARQIFHWMHRRGVLDVAEMSDLPGRLRLRLAEEWRVTASEEVRRLASRDGLTSKALLRLHDGQDVEAVEMLTQSDGPHRPRKTICISTQAGCAMACVFCVTGQFGFARNLEAGEVVEQVLRFGDATRPVTNVVFMGMGEPLANYDETLRAIRLLGHAEGLHLGARRMTLSTSGLVPQIRQLAREGLQVGLAISLHAPNDDLRTRIMPVNRRWPIAELLDAAEEYTRLTGRRVTYEYALMADLNDSDAQARELAALLGLRLSHVNLIPLNPTEDPSLRAPSMERARSFLDILLDAGVPATVRLNRGRDINAACGQLRLSERRRAQRKTDDSAPVGREEGERKDRGAVSA